jgi:hypothetical protein
MFNYFIMLLILLFAYGSIMLSTMLGMVGSGFSLPLSLSSSSSHAGSGKKMKKAVVEKQVVLLEWAYIPMEGQPDVTWYVVWMNKGCKQVESDPLSNGKVWSNVATVIHPTKQWSSPPLKIGTYCWKITAVAAIATATSPASNVISTIVPVMSFVPPIGNDPLVDPSKKAFVPYQIPLPDVPDKETPYVDPIPFVPIATSASVPVPGKVPVVEKRRKSTVSHFRKLYACPLTNSFVGKCHGYVVDHITPLCAGGKDSVENMQWQTWEESLIKDSLERKQCDFLHHRDSSLQVTPYK